MTSHDVILAHWTACTEASRRNHAECSPSRKLTQLEVPLKGNNSI